VDVKTALNCMELALENAVILYLAKKYEKTRRKSANLLYFCSLSLLNRKPNMKVGFANFFTTHCIRSTWSFLRHDSVPGGGVRDRLVQDRGAGDDVAVVAGAAHRQNPW
jgi:hypothetical protein